MQMLENPSNLFVVDLAVLATSEDSSATLHDAHSYACFFLGTCLQALPDVASADVGEANGGSSRDGEPAFHVSRKLLLDIIDTKIGLTRFTDVLKRRIALETKLLSHGSQAGHKQHSLDNLKSVNFLAFMNSQREAIRKAIYDHYSGSLPSGTSNSAESSALTKIIDLQKEEILRLTDEIAGFKGNHQYSSHL